MQGRTAFACIALAAAAAGAAIAMKPAAAETGTYTPLSCHAGMSRQQIGMVATTDALAEDLYTIQAGQESGAAHTADIAADWAAGFAGLVCDYQQNPRAIKNEITPAQALPSEVSSLRYAGAKFTVSGFVITIYGATSRPAADNSDVITAVTYRPGLCSPGMTKTRLEQIAAADQQASQEFFSLQNADWEAASSATGPKLDTLSSEQGAEDYGVAMAGSASEWCDDLDMQLATGQPLSKIAPGAPGHGYADFSAYPAGPGPW